MASPPVTARPEDAVRTAARTMRRERVGCVVVVERGRAVGVLTESDVVRLVADDVDLDAMQVRAAMSSPAVTVAPSADVHDAATLMRDRGVKRLIVALEGEVRGVITVRDLAYAEPELARRFQDALRADWRD